MILFKDSFASLDETVVSLILGWNSNIKFVGYVMEGLIKLSFLSVLFTSHVFSQNLVPNPSFECGVDECTGTSTAWEFENYGFACQWNSPTFGTPDILSLDLPSGCWSTLPVSTIGTQLPRSGRRMAGIHIVGSSDDLTEEWHEYLQVKLEKPLIPNQYYCTEMYVSLAEEVHLASNNIGMSFNEAPVADYLIYHHLPLVPQILETEIINDTQHWVRVGGEFMATNSANYLIIGNFFSNSETLTSSDMTGFLPNFSYYFIDDVSVEKRPDTNFSFSGNLSICKGDSVVIYATVGTHYIEWSDMANPSEIIHIGTQLHTKPAKTTSYLAKAKGCGITIEDTVTVVVKQIPDVDLGGEAAMCEGTSLTLDAGVGHASYKWNDQSENQYLTVADTGIYSVTVRNGLNCESSDTVHVRMKHPPTVNIGRDTVLCDQFFPIVAKTNDNDLTFLWSDGSADSILKPSESGNHWLTVENECGTATDSINIYSINDIFIPNVLTLNGDTFNNKLTITGFSSDQSPMLTIFNRWGRQVYSSKHYRGDWPDREQDLGHGMYYYILSYPGCRDYKGWVQVLK